MKLAVLGAGDVLYQLVRAFNDSSSFTLTALGADKLNREAAKAMEAFAVEKNIPFLSHYSELDRYDFDFVLMLSYPSLIPLNYLEKYNFLNIHYAPLPKYRGFHGFVWSIINGEKQTGYTLHKVTDGIDDGPIYYQYLTDISSSDDVISILKRIDFDINNNLLRVLLEIGDGSRKPVKQNESEAIYVCKRKWKDGLIDWKWPKMRVYNFVRALKPPYTPGAFSFFNEKKIIINSVELWHSPDYFSIEGQIVARILGRGVLVKCGDGVILLKEVVYNDKPENSFDLFSTVGQRLG